MENWRRLVNFPNYEGSDEGRIRNIKTQRILKPYVDNRGRAIVCLKKNNSRHAVGVRKAIADTFLGEHPGLDTRNKDRDATNNRPDNIEWCTRSEIVSDLFQRGDRLPSRGTAVRVKETNDIYRSATECARAIGCDPSEIFKCLNGQRKHIKGYHIERV